MKDACKRCKKVVDETEPYYLFPDLDGGIFCEACYLKLVTGALEADGWKLQKNGWFKK